MAQMVLVIGESGTGKSTSLRNCDPTTTAVVNPVGKPLPFKGKFTMLNGETDARKIIRFMRDQVTAGKKLIAVDDFQYILAVPYMDRIKETGWDKFNDFGSNYFEIIKSCKDLPDDVVIVFYSHLETLDNGLTTVKLIGKLLREKITIEGLFTVVLRTGVAEAKYYFYTQNSGKDTVKSPIGMFPTYAIDNDMAYVADKIRNYYAVGLYKSDDAMRQADAAVASDVEKPTRRRAKAAEPVATGKRIRKTRDDVIEENNQNVAEYMENVDRAVTEAIGDAEEVPFDEAMQAAEAVAKPDLKKPPRRSRKDTVPTHAEISVTICTEDTYFRTTDGNYIMRGTGEEYPGDGEVISKEEFMEGAKRIANPTQGAARRTRRRREER